MLNAQAKSRYAQSRYQSIDPELIKLEIKTQLDRAGIEPTATQIDSILAFIDEHVKADVLLLDVDNTLVNLHDAIYPFQGSLKNFDVLIPVLRFAQAMGIEIGIVTSRSEQMNRNCSSNGLVTVDDIVAYLRSEGVSINSQLIFMRDTLAAERDKLTNEYTAIKRFLEYAESNGLENSKVQANRGRFSQLDNMIRGKNLELMHAQAYLKLPANDPNAKARVAIADDESKQVQCARDAGFKGIDVPPIDSRDPMRHLTDIAYITGGAEVEGLADLVGLNAFFNTVINQHADDRSLAERYYTRELVDLALDYKRELTNRASDESRGYPLPEVYLHKDVQDLFRNLQSVSNVNKYFALQALIKLSFLTDFSELLNRQYSHYSGATILGMALIGQWMHKNNIEMIQCLVDRQGQFRANPNAPFVYDGRKYTPLQFALINDLSPKVINSLINAGAKIEGLIDNNDLYDYALEKSLDPKKQNIELFNIIASAVDKKDSSLRERLMSFLMPTASWMPGWGTEGAFVGILKQNNTSLLHAVLKHLQYKDLQRLMSVKSVKKKVNELVSSKAQNLFTKTLYLYFVRLLETKSVDEFYVNAVVAPKTGGNGRANSRRSKQRSSNRSNQDSASHKLAVPSSSQQVATSTSRTGSVSSSTETPLVKSVAAETISSLKEVLRQYLIIMGDYINKNKNKHMPTAKRRPFVDHQDPNYYHGFVPIFQKLFAYHVSVCTWLESLEQGQQPTAVQFEMILTQLEAYVTEIKKQNYPVIPIPRVLLEEILKPLKARGLELIEQDQVEQDRRLANQNPDIMDASSLGSAIIPKVMEQLIEMSAPSAKNLLTEFDRLAQNENNQRYKTMKGNFTGRFGNTEKTLELLQAAQQKLNESMRSSGSLDEDSQSFLSSVSTRSDDLACDPFSTVTRRNGLPTYTPELEETWLNGIQGQQGECINANTRQRDLSRPPLPEIWRQDLKQSTEALDLAGSRGGIGGHRNSVFNNQDGSKEGNDQKSETRNWVKARTRAGDSASRMSVDDTVIKGKDKEVSNAVSENENQVEQHQTEQDQANNANSSSSKSQSLRN